MKTSASPTGFPTGGVENTSSNIYVLTYFTIFPIEKANGIRILLEYLKNSNPSKKQMASYFVSKIPYITYQIRQI